MRHQHDTLDVLINNAGAHFRDRQLTREGIERHLAVDHLAAFLFITLLRPALEAAAPSRIVTWSPRPCPPLPADPRAGR